eukprot:1154499-Pelagomonas_calceolata.AAC.2
MRITRVGKALACSGHGGPQKRARLWCKCLHVCAQCSPCYPAAGTQDPFLEGSGSAGWAGASYCGQSSQTAALQSTAPNHIKQAAKQGVSGGNAPVKWREHGKSKGTFFLLCAWLHNEASPFRSVAVQTLEGNSAANEGGRSESCFRASSQVRSLVQKYVQATHQACSGMVAGHKQGGIFRAADACFESPSMLPCVNSDLRDDILLLNLLQLQLRMGIAAPHTTAHESAST